MQPRHIHDTAWSIAQNVLRVVDESIPEAAKVDAFHRVYCEVVKGLYQMATTRDREWQRLHPIRTSTETSGSE